MSLPTENSTWGAPRIHGELLKLGFDVSERSVSRWIRRAPRDPDPVKRWLTFLRNHREAIAAMDFFTVPTLHIFCEHLRGISLQSQAEEPKASAKLEDSLLVQGTAIWRTTWPLCALKLGA